MDSNIEILDCTLRDGAYIVEGKFGRPAIKGIISKLQLAGVEMIECGWLKDGEHIAGTSFYHVPDDLIQYIDKKNNNSLYVVMIDWDRYNIDNLPICDGKSVDAIRVVFPHGKHRQGIQVAEKIKDKGYKIYLQAANTLAYTDEELISLATDINVLAPEGISVVDTFGAMYEDDLERIVTILDRHLAYGIKLGFHSHNNQQMAFANSMHFVKLLSQANRGGIVDASLCGMGRGAGNATTELVANFLNSRCKHNYDLDEIMDAIDIYMTGFQERYTWGYSTAYYIAGMYCCHVNNIAYLQNNHRTNSRDMRNIIESLSPESRKKYDYDLLEEKYIENQNRRIDDSEAIAELKSTIGISGDENKKVLLIAPGKTSLVHQYSIKQFIEEKKPVVIAVNAILPGYEYDYLFLTNSARYEYAKNTYPAEYDRTKKILLSNIKNSADDKEYVINFNKAIKRGWPHFDNAVICALRLMDRIRAGEIYLAGFDGFKGIYNESYADESLPTLNTSDDWNGLNVEIKDMFEDVKATTKLRITFLTDSIFSE